MNQLTILGPAASSYVRTARMVCVEKSVPHVLEPLGEAHAGLHPWKRVPILQHGALTLIETSAIGRYVDAIGSGPSLVPSAPAELARMEQWISTINAYAYDSLVRNYALKYIGPKLQGKQPNLDEIAANVPKLEQDLTRLDAAYANSKWIAGETLSLADLFVGPIVATVAMFPEGKAALGKARSLSRALEQLAQRESFVTAHAGLGG